MTERRSRTETSVTKLNGQNGKNGKTPQRAAALRHEPPPTSGLTARLATRPHTRDEAEERYVVARDAWAAAMRAASSGRPADLAALAIAQEAYEAALHERERWESVPKTAIAIQPDRTRGIEAVVGNEMIRREVHEHEQDPQPRGLRRLFRRKPRG